MTASNGDEIPSVATEIATFRAITSAAQSWTDFNFSKWWNVHQKQFPRISRIKMKYDCVSATTLDAEQAFSIASYSVSKYSNRMKPEKLELRMKTKVNLAPLLKKKIQDMKLNIFDEDK